MIFWEICGSFELAVHHNIHSCLSPNVPEWIFSGFHGANVITKALPPHPPPPPALLKAFEDKIGRKTG